MKRVLIAGYGFLGEVVARRLVEQGDEVLAMSRSDRPVPAGAVSLRGDLRDRECLRNLPTNLSHVVFCAGADSHTEAAYQATYIDALGCLIGTLRGRGAAIPKMLFTSSTAVYEQSSGEWVDEETTVLPQYFPGRVMLEAEALLHSLVPEACVLRCAGIYGQGRPSLVDSVRRGTASYSAEHPVYTNRIHKEDCAAAIVALLAMPSVTGLYVACDNHPAARRELLVWLARVLQAPAPTADDCAATRRGSNKRCRNTRLLLGTGITLRFPTFREGYSHDLGLRS